MIFDQIDGGEGHTPKNKNMPNGCARTARRPLLLLLLRCTYVPIFDAHSVDCLLSNPSGQKFVPNLCLCYCCAFLAPLRGDPQRRLRRRGPWPEEDPTDHTDRSIAYTHTMTKVESPFGPRGGCPKTGKKGAGGILLSIPPAHSLPKVSSRCCRLEMSIFLSFLRFAACPW